MSRPLESRVALRVRYYSGAESTVTVTAGDWSAEFLARRGPNEVWLVLPDADRAVREIELVGDGRATVCVTAVAAGVPEDG